MSKNMNFNKIHGKNLRYFIDKKREVLQTKDIVKTSFVLVDCCWAAV